MKRKWMNFETMFRSLKDGLRNFLKENSIKYHSEHLDPSDMKGLMQIVEDKRALEQLKKLYQM